MQFTYNYWKSQSGTESKVISEKRHIIQLYNTNSYINRQFAPLFIKLHSAIHKGRQFFPHGLLMNVLVSHIPYGFNWDTQSNKFYCAVPYWSVSNSFDRLSTSAKLFDFV